jgi:hypothetical protein
LSIRDAYNEDRFMYFDLDQKVSPDITLGVASIDVSEGAGNTVHFIHPVVSGGGTIPSRRRNLIRSAARCAPPIPR